MLCFSHSVCCGFNLYFLLCILQSELGINKVLTVGWDVHHANSTREMFWKDPRVLFFSVIRHEFGTCYPANDDGFYTMIGEGPGEGHNINVFWENGNCGGSDYLAIWDNILLSVAKEFGPDITIISAGFDAGGCCVTPYGYSIMVKKLMDFAQGKIVLALGGDYNLDSISNSVLAYMKVLLEDKPVVGSLESYPFESMQHVIHALNITSSDSEDEDIGSEKLGSVHLDVIKPLSKLTVEDGDAEVGTATSWRSELSKVDIWYATFGSNMWKPRFFCYIEGGQVESMRKSLPGSKDRTLPKEILWKTYPHRLFFGGEFSHTWGPGGVAFLGPECNIQHKAYLLLYRITLEQFNDVLLQENFNSYDMSSPFFNINDLNSVTNEKSMSLEALKTPRPKKKGKYYNVVYLGKERNFPIMTMTCSLSDVEKFKSGELTLNAPAKEYAGTLLKGLVEGKLLSDEEAKAYIYEASNKPL